MGANRTKESKESKIFKLKDIVRPLLNESSIIVIFHVILLMRYTVIIIY